MFKKLLIFFYFCLFFLTLCSGCSRNPVTGKNELDLISRETEVRIGEKNYFSMQQAQGGLYCADSKIGEYVSTVGKNLARHSDRPDLPYEFVVLNNTQPNAWALPGGKIAVNRGLLLELKNEAELAAVLSHEIVHAAAKHSAKRLQQGWIFHSGLLGLGIIVKDHDYRDLIGATGNIMSLLLLQKYSRTHELEADRYGMEYMERASYNSFAAVELQKTFLRLSAEREKSWLTGLFSSHPPSQERVEKNLDTAKKFSGKGFLREEEYRKKIERLEKTREAYSLYEKSLGFLRKGEVQIALKSIEGALEIEPKEALFYGLYGEAKFMQKSYPEALLSFDKSVELNNRYYKFYLNRGLLKRECNDPLGAQKDLEKSVDLLPTAEAHNALGEIYIQRSREEEAVFHFQKAMQSKSFAGEKARRNIARIEMPRFPEKFLQFYFSLDDFRNLVLTIHNRSPIDVNSLSIELILPSGMWGIRKRFIHIKEKIKSEEKRSVSTRLGPFKNLEEIRSIVNLKISNLRISDR